MTLWDEFLSAFKKNAGPLGAVVRFYPPDESVESL